ncbi:MAG: hypothetical protein ACJAY8_001182, partial [Sphingobacteriales bacterium]
PDSSLEGVVQKIHQLISKSSEPVLDFEWT